MEAEDPRANHVPHILQGTFPALSATLFISMGYIDPGKWIACIDSGARFGGELFVFLFLFNLMAMLCQYLSAHIGVITGKNLAQICNDEYDKFNCIFLGIQAELSIVISDLAMILGIANALHMMFRVDLFSAVLLTALTAILYPLFSTLLESSKANVILSRTAALTFVCYVLGMLIAQPEISTSPIILPSKLMGENVYALMTLLGANIMPHNFFLHSSVVQRFQGSTGAARASQAYDNFFSIFSVFSGIFLVNYVLMNSASNMFYSSGIVLPTFLDAISMMEQSSWISIGPLVFFLLLSSSHISGLSWDVGGENGQTILYDFFGIDLPGWLHCATVRIFAVVPVLYCLWYSGAEGMYQMLLATQVMVALLLPPSVIALYRVASSGVLMGTNKVSTAMEFLMMMSFMAMIGLQLVFFGEMVFGDGAWLGYLRNMGSTSLFSPYFILIVTGCASLCLTCRLFVTPLRSSDHTADAQTLKWDRPQDVHKPLAEKQGNDMVDSRDREERFRERPGLVPSTEKVLETRSNPPPIYDFNLPDTIMETDQVTYITPIEEISTVKESSVTTLNSLEQPAMFSGSVLVPEVMQDHADVPSLPTGETETGATELPEKTLRVEGEPVARKDGEERESWEPEETSKEMVQVTVLPAAPEGFRSLSGKLDEGGSGTGSLSRLSGLGRAARRQLAAVLDEFWGQLYDFHGQLTQEAKAKKLDMLLCADSNSKPSPSLQEASSVTKDFRTHFQSDSMLNSGLGDLSSQPRMPNSVGSLYGVQKGSSPSLWPDKTQMLDAYLQNTGTNALDNSERRYSSLRLPPRSEGVNQPATMHGYQISSYLNRTMMDPSADYLDGQRKYASMKIPSSSLGMHNLRDPLTYGLGPKTTNGFSSMQPSAFHNNLTTSRNNMMQSHKSGMMQSDRSGMMQSDRSGMMQSDRSGMMQSDRSGMIQSDRSGMMQSDRSGMMQSDRSGMMQSDRSGMKQSDRSGMMQSDRSDYELFSPAPADDATSQNNTKKYHSLPDISGISVPLRDVYLSDKYAQLGSPNTSSGYPNSLGRANPDRSLYSSLASRMGPPGFDDLSPRKARRDIYPSRSYSGLDTGSIWCKQPYEQYGVANKISLGVEGASVGHKSVTNVDSATSIVDWEVKLLQSLRNCILKLLKLEGSEWLFRQGDGVDEDLIDRMAARERFVLEAEFRDMKMANNANESPYSAGAAMRPGSGSFSGSAMKGDVRSAGVTSVPHCGEGCVWKADLIVSFGVWCIHRILELSLMESRPELWGKYTYVLNRLQGVIEPAFFKQRRSVLACFCLEIPKAYQQSLSPVSSGGALPPTARSPKGKFTTSLMLIEIIKDVEVAISSRKGRSGTAAGDVAFPKGKENLASVLKRFKRRLSNKPVGGVDATTRPGSRNLLAPGHYGS